MRTRTVTYVAAAALAATTAVVEGNAPSQASSVDFVKKAEVYVARGSWPEAIEAYTYAIKEHPKDAALRNQLGICHQYASDPKRAQKAYKAAIRLRPDYAEAWNNLGTLEHSRSRHREAVGYYARAIELKPGDAVTHRNLGMAWAALGDVEKALMAWDEAYRIDPGSLDGAGRGRPTTGLRPARQYFLFAKLLAARGEIDRALAYLAKAHALGFQDFETVESDTDFAGLVADPRYIALRTTSASLPRDAAARPRP